VVEPTIMIEEEMFQEIKKLQDITKNLILTNQMILIKRNNVNQILGVYVTTRGQKARMFKEELQERKFSLII